MENDKQYHILLVEDDQVTISSVQKDLKIYGKNISLTIMSRLNTENDGSNGDIDEYEPVLFHDNSKKIWLSVYDILNNKFDLILLDTNMQHHTTNSLLELLIQKNIPTPIIGTSTSPEQSNLYGHEYVEKNKVTKNFKENIIHPLKSGLFLKKRQQSEALRKNIIENRNLINQETLQHIANSLKSIKIRYRIFWKFF